MRYILPGILMVYVDDIPQYFADLGDYFLGPYEYATMAVLDKFNAEG